jgi:NitT/TauT family transport system permease protein
MREKLKITDFFGKVENKKKTNISEERIQYLRKIKRNKLLVVITRLAIIIVFIAGWEILADVGIIDSFITSSPSRIWNTFINLSQTNLIEHVGITCLETIIGFVLGTLLGMVIAVILWWSKFLSKVLEPFLVVLNSLPKVALGPVIIIWVGAGMPAIITMALLISLVVTIMEILNGFLETDKEKIKMAETFNASKWQLLTKIVIPANIPTFLNTLKVNIGLSLVGVITGEFLVSKAGLGYLIVYGGQVFKLDLVMTGVIILAIVAAIMYQMVAIAEKLIIKK